MWVLNLVNLSTASSMLLYDGSPFHPTPDVLLRLAKSVGYVLSTVKSSKRALSENFQGHCIWYITTISIRAPKQGYPSSYVNRSFAYGHWLTLESTGLSN